MKILETPGRICFQRDFWPNLVGIGSSGFQSFMSPFLQISCGLSHQQFPVWEKFKAIFPSELTQLGSRSVLTLLQVLLSIFKKNRFFCSLKIMKNLFHVRVKVTSWSSSCSSNRKGHMYTHRQNAQMKTIHYTAFMNSLTLSSFIF